MNSLAFVGAGNVIQDGGVLFIVCSLTHKACKLQVEDTAHFKYLYV